MQENDNTTDDCKTVNSSEEEVCIFEQFSQDIYRQFSRPEETNVYIVCPIILGTNTVCKRTTGRCKTKRSLSIISWL